MNIRKALVKAIIYIFLLYVLYIIGAIIGLGGGCNTMSSEIHILPSGYTGKVYIFFNQGEGYDVEYQNNSRIYRIPKSGILRTQFKSNSGWTNSKEDLMFYYKENNSLIPLNKFISGRDSIDYIDSNSIVVFEYGIGAGWEAFGQGEINTTTYLVDSLKNFKKRKYTLTKEKFNNWDQ